jgi:2-hydroxycyclohexanecarboxyl-CoA dehydrogenase
MLTGTVVVTGGGSGIGRATAERAAREGAAVAVVDRATDNAAETVRLVSEAGGRALAYACDVGDDESVAETVQRIGRDLGRVTGVVTAAGIFHGADLQPAHQVPVEDFVHVLRVNLVGTFAVIKHALPMLIDGGGAIVTIASTAAIRGHGFGAGYTASKGGVDTPMTGGTFATDDAIARAKRRVPIGRYAQARDIGDVAIFLLSDDARYLTGQTIPVEGGATIA